ncbi:reverse transcriptase domain-containing protein [Tanacetum coccineum]
MKCLKITFCFTKYGVTHKLSTAYHPQSNGQTKVTNKAIKRILERSVGYNPKDWSERFNDALWAFRTAYKTPTWCTPFRLVYKKACHLPVEIEHKAHWALKQCNIDLTLASKSRLMQLNELAELRDGAYENTKIYKEQTKKWHDSRLRGDKSFKVGDKVLLYNSRLKMYPGKLKSKWSGPNIVKTVYPYGVVEIIDRNGFNFKVNGQRLNKYYGGNIEKEDDEVIEFENGVTDTHEECPKNPGLGVAKNLKKPCQASKGVLVGPKVDFLPAKEYRPVSKKPTANSSGNKKKVVEPTKENVETSSTSTTRIVEKIGKIEKLIIDGKITLVDDDGKPLKKVDHLDDHDSEDEVESVDNDMAYSMASERVGFRTQTLLEQWKDS